MFNFVGNKKIMDFLARCIEKNKLGHAYLFVGQESLGKKTLAMFIAAHLLGVQTDDLAKESDFLFIGQEKDEKTGKTKKDISIDQIRKAVNFFSQKSFTKGIKIAIIDNAHKMNKSTANALLKTLEEPRGKSVLFIIAEDLNEIPSTVISRCQVFSFGVVQRQEIVEYLASLGASSSQALEIASTSLGLPGKAINLFLNENDLVWHRQEADNFRHLFGLPFYEKLKRIEYIFDSKSDHIAQREKIYQILGIWLLVLRDLIYGGNNSISINSAINLYDKITEARELILNNIHPRVVVENILLSIK